MMPSVECSEGLHPDRRQVFRDRVIVVEHMNSEVVSRSVPGSETAPFRYREQLPRV